jgi:hypothetical protein
VGLRDDADAVLEIGAAIPRNFVKNLISSRAGGELFLGTSSHPSEICLSVA